MPQGFEKKLDLSDNESIKALLIFNVTLRCWYFEIPSHIPCTMSLIISPLKFTIKTQVGKVYCRKRVKNNGTKKVTIFLFFWLQSSNLCKILIVEFLFYFVVQKCKIFNFFFNYLSSCNNSTKVLNLTRTNHKLVSE